ncbi:MAG TPA: hypothetical protein VIU64_21865 [Polyangia bacterium]
MESRGTSCRDRRPGTRSRSSTLPNIIVYADVRAGVPTPPTLFALSEARRIARGAGASVFALVATPPLGNKSLVALSVPLAAAGADKLLLCEADEFAGPPDDAVAGRALDAAVARIPPVMVLFPAGGTGAVLGPPLAARLGAPFAPWSDFVVSDADGKALRGRGRVQVLRLRPDGRTRRRLDPAQIERPIIATVGAGRCPAPSGSERNLEIDVLPMAPPRINRPVARVVAQEPSPHEALPQAAVLILVADGDPSATAINAAWAERMAGGTRGASLSPDSPPSHLAPLAPARDPGLPLPVAVASADRTPRSVLAACCPEIVIRVDSCTATTARSPRTLVIRATSSDPGAQGPPPDDVDVVWWFGSAAELVDLALQLGARA